MAIVSSDPYTRKWVVLRKDFDVSACWLNLLFPWLTMQLKFPPYVYRQKVGNNYVYHELLSSEKKEVTTREIGRGSFTGVELSVLDSEDKILVIGKNTSSGAVDDYNMVLLIKTDSTLNDDYIEKHIARGERKKHPKMTAESQLNMNDLDAVRNSREGNVRIKPEVEERNIRGLRNPQIGALYSILSNDTTDNKVATVVMPTGTGKTETMLAALLMLRCHRLLVIVPTDPLRDQVSSKFIHLGILRDRDFGIVGNECISPVVGVLSSSFKTVQEIDDFFLRCNVIVTTMKVISLHNQILQNRISDACSHLFIDEAHHTPAKTRNDFKEVFGTKSIVQFTATPFRNDKKPISGKIIYNYSLRKAQEEGYFKSINFKHVFEFDKDLVDSQIRNIAIQQLREDVSEGKQHILMARCENIAKANRIFQEFYSHLTEFNPVVVHTGISLSERKKNLEKLKTLESRIVVCVDMLGEGYDLPNLKIAALHCPHKSLGVTLQFIGRFTRTSSSDIGEATFVANIADEKFRDSLQELYLENSDWNSIVSRASFTEVDRQVRIQDFVGSFEHPDIESGDISMHSVKVPFSAVFIKAEDIGWSEQNIKRCLSNSFNIDDVIHLVSNSEKTVVIVEKIVGYPDFGGSKQLRQIQYVIHVVCYDEDNHMFYILSDAEDRREKMIRAFCSTYQIVKNGDVFKSFHGINRLQYFIVGMREGVVGRVKYRMIAGSDVHPQPQEIINKERSNIFALGYEDGSNTSIGASSKGKIRAKLNGSLVERKEWCKHIGRKLKDPLIDANVVLGSALTEIILGARPNLYPLSIEWSDEVYKYWDKIFFEYSDGLRVGIEIINFELVSPSEDGDILFQMRYDENHKIVVALTIYEEPGPVETIKKYKYQVVEGGAIKVIKSSEMDLVSFLDLYPPIIRFCNGSYMRANSFFALDYTNEPFDLDNIQTRDWGGTVITMESERLSSIRTESIQHKMIQELIDSENYDVIFNDDGAQEIADIVAFKTDNNKVVLELYHCKYSQRSTAGNRVKDLYEVCGQTQNSIRWNDIQSTIKRLQKRGAEHPERFRFGDAKRLLEIQSMLKLFPHEMKIYIVQPGLEKSSISRDQKELLAVTNAYLHFTYQIGLGVIASQ